MTIFETRYSTTDFTPVGPWKRLLPLAMMEFGRLFRTRLGVFGFILCCSYTLFLLAVVQFHETDWVKTMLAVNPTLSPTRPDFYMKFSVESGWLPFLGLSCVIGVRAISGDRAVNALEIYWTRGISPWGYFVAKWAGFFFLLATVFVGGPLLAWLYALLTSSSADFLQETIPFMPRVLLALTLKSLVLALLAVAFSAVCDSPKKATFIWVLVLGLSAAISRVMEKIARHQMRANPELVPDGVTWHEAVYLPSAMVRIEQSVAGLGTGPTYPVWIACTCIGVVLLALLWPVKRVLRTTEAVA